MDNKEKLWYIDKPTAASRWPALVLINSAIHTHNVNHDQILCRSLDIIIARERGTMGKHWSVAQNLHPDTMIRNEIMGVLGHDSALAKLYWAGTT